MAVRTRRPWVKLECKECGGDNYFIQKPKGKKIEIEDLEPNKFCNNCREHTAHEAKIR